MSEANSEQGMSGVRAVTVQLRDPQGAEPATWGMAEEVAVEIDLNGEPLAVTMASPTLLEELAVGFVFTEGVVLKPRDITAVHTHRHLEGWIVDLRLPADAIDPSARRGRLLEGRAGCGLCGVDSLSAAMRRPPVNPELPREPVSDSAVHSALSALAAHQTLNQATRSVHAAAWCDLDGQIRHVCEDVGRHNALDKLVGKAIRHGAPEPGFVLLSSRVSYELVCKATALGASLLASVSAPTTLALDLAEQAGLPLAFAGPDGSIGRVI